VTDALESDGPTPGRATGPKKQLQKSGTYGDVTFGDIANRDKCKQLTLLLQQLQALHTNIQHIHSDKSVTESNDKHLIILSLQINLYLFRSGNRRGSGVVLKSLVQIIPISLLSGNLSYTGLTSDKSKVVAAAAAVATAAVYLSRISTK